MKKFLLLFLLIPALSFAANTTLVNNQCGLRDNGARPGLNCTVNSSGNMFISFYNLVGSPDGSSISYSTNNGSSWTNVKPLGGDNYGKSGSLNIGDSILTAAYTVAADTNILITKFYNGAFISIDSVTHAGRYRNSNLYGFLGLKSDSSLICLVRDTADVTDSLQPVYSSARLGNGTALNTTWTVGHGLLYTLDWDQYYSRTLNGILIFGPTTRNLYYTNGPSFDTVATNFLPTAAVEGTDASNVTMATIRPQDSIFAVAWELADSILFTIRKMRVSGGTWTTVSLNKDTKIDGPTGGSSVTGSHNSILNKRNPTLSWSSDGSKLLCWYKKWPNTAIDTNINLCYKISSDSGATWGSEVIVENRSADTMSTMQAPQAFYKSGTFGYPWISWANGNLASNGAPFYVAIDTITISLPRRKSSHKLSL